ncbi:MAG: radical SAM protein [Chitinivibrionales bacterium]|nr:radical SAM protein [Chitinivibrionales bacterium]
MPHALIINPWATDFKLYDEWMHPLGLYFLLSLLQHNNWEIDFVNCLDRGPSTKTKRYDTGDFDSRGYPRPAVYRSIPRRYKMYGISCEEFNLSLDSLTTPDIIFVGSGMTYWYPGLAATLDHLRTRYPRIPILVGGTTATLMPHLLTNRDEYTFVFTGPLTARAGGPPLELPGGHALGCADWSPGLIDAFKHFDTLRHGPILATTGCPYSCTYCASKQLQGPFNPRPIERVVKETGFLIDTLGVSNCSFFDDALLYDSNNHFFPLMNEIPQADICFHAPNGLHLRWITTKTAALMKKRNFKTLRFGYESGMGKYSKDTNQKASLRLVEEKTSLLYDAGFEGRDIGIYVMAGLPGQRPDDVIGEIKAVAQFGTKVKPVFLSPVPHTPLFGYYAELFPQIRTDPLWQNDVFFITQLSGWDEKSIEEIKHRGKAGTQ